MIVLVSGLVGVSGLVICKTLLKISAKNPSFSNLMFIVLFNQAESLLLRTDKQTERQGQMDSGRHRFRLIQQLGTTEDKRKTRIPT